MWPRRIVFPRSSRSLAVVRRIFSNISVVLKSPDKLIFGTHRKRTWVIMRTAPSGFCIKWTTIWSCFLLLSFKNLHGDSFITFDLITHFGFVSSAHLASVTRINLGPPNKAHANSEATPSPFVIFRCAACLVLPPRNFGFALAIFPVNFRLNANVACDWSPTT